MIQRLEIGETFSLTPALSRWEREKRSPRFGNWLADKSNAVFDSAALKFYATTRRLFPLPAGEGQGEGERRERLAGLENIP